MEKWYSTNFGNEQVIQGKTTTFLRFQNLIPNNIPNANLWILPVIETLGTEEKTEKIYFNGADVSEIEKIYKSNLNYQKLKNSNDKFVLWTGGPKTPDLNLGIEETYGQVLPVLDTVPDKSINTIGLGNLQTVRWVDAPSFNQSNITNPNRDVNEKQSFRIDYTGEGEFVCKIMFLVTNLDPSNPEFIDKLPAINPDNINEKTGDIRLNGNEWEYFNSGWNSFTTPLNINNDGYPIYGIKHLIEEGLFQPGSGQDYFFDFQETYIFCYPESKNQTSRNKYWVNHKITEKQVSDDLDSFMLLRTNPKLSGNIKIVMEETGNLFFDTIEANDELANEKYKRNRINPRSSFQNDLKKYFSTIDSELLYEIFEKSENYTNSKRNFSEQYDFFYGYGASQLNSKYYSENFKLFAPLWIRKKLPEFFVIFKVRGPINPETYLNQSRQELLKSVWENSKIIKSYDLRPGTTFGDYFTKLVEDSRFKEEPLQVSYQNQTLTSWSGVSYKEGIISDKGEYLSDFFRNDNTIHDFEDFITSGFKRNNIISTNLINLEFLFNDNTSDDYEINRYFGFYINENELAKFKIYTDGFDNFTNQTPLPRKNIDGQPYSTQPFKQSNPDGINIPVKYFQGSWGSEPEIKEGVDGKLPLSSHVNDKFRVFYLKDKDNQLSRIKNINDVLIDKNENVDKFTSINLYDTEKNISQLTGIQNIKTQIPSRLLQAGNGQIELNITDEQQDGRSIFEEGEELIIELTDINQEKQKWKLIANSTGLQPGSFWNYPVYDPNEKVFKNNFSPIGTPEQVAKSLSGCINSFENRIFSAIRKENNIYIRIFNTSESGNSFTFQRNLIKNSVIRNLKFYQISPKQCFQFTGDSKLNLNSNFSIIDFSETCQVDRINQYEIRLTDIITGYDDFYVFEIYRNGGKIDKIQVIENQNFNYSDNDIEFTIILENKSVNINDKWNFVPETTLISQRFLGGTSRNRNRASIPINDLENMDPNIWFQSQKGFYSQLIKWNVQGEDIIGLNDLEIPIRDNQNQIIDYENLGTRKIIQLNKDEFEFYRTNQNRIVGFDIFKPSVNLMSFLPVKDFDFDFIKSDYAYTPSGEIDNYFSNIELSEGDEKVIGLDEYFKVVNGSIKLFGFSDENGWAPILNDEGVYIEFSDGENFNTYLPNYQYKTDINSSNNKYSGLGNQREFFYRGYQKLKYLVENNISQLKIIANNETVIEKFNFSADNDLVDFTGFLGISDFISAEDIQDLEKLIENNNEDRFFFGQLLSEYDRLRERFLTNYAVTSKVVPYINKWTLTGTDSRDNKYRLNNSLAFGVNNLSPDYEIQEQNPRLNTHEFYYLDKFPYNYDIELLENSRSYFFEGISEKMVEKNGKLYSWYQLFHDNDNDWFSKYFTIGYPTEINQIGENVLKEKSERYIYTDYVSGDETVQGIFRGGKFKILEIDTENNEIIQESEKYKNWKFSAILRIERLNIFTNEPPSDIEFIANEKYQTIVMVITLYVNDYRVKQGGYGFLFLYGGIDSLRDSNQIYLENESDPYLKLDIMTQRHFDEFKGGGLLNYADIKLSGIFNTNISPIQDRKFNVISNTEKEFFPPNEINIVDNGEYNLLETYLGTNFYVTPFEFGDYSEFSQFIPRLSEMNDRRYIINNQPGSTSNIIVGLNNIEIKTPNNIGYNYLGNTNNISGWPSRKMLGSVNFNFNSDIIREVSLWYLTGGKGYLEERISDISFANLVERVNTDNPTVRYKTVLESGEIILNNYKFRFIHPDEFRKDNTLTVIEDLDKPSVYLEKDLIGFDLERLPDGDILFRHRGKYLPKFRNVLNYWVRESESFTKHFDIDYLLGNTRLGIERNDFGVIENIYHNKISNGEIMKISSESEYRSLYPLIDESGIDYKDFFTFSTNWDNEYYDFYQTRFGKNDEPVSNPEKIEGTFEMKETKSFFGSKIMNVPNIFEFFEFNNNEIEEILTESITSTDISQLLDFENNPNLQSINPENLKDSLILTIDVEERIIRNFIENNGIKDFEMIKEMGITRFSNISEEELEKIYISYLRKNIIQLYRVSEIIVLKKLDAIEGEDPIFRSDLTEIQQNELGYIPKEGANIIRENALKHRILINIDTKKFNSYTVRVKVERR